MVPESHPRYKSLLNRDRIVEAFESGVLAKGGMIAHGRGETFDYLIGENTTDVALNSIKVSAALLVLAENPVISVNGNSVALAKDEFVELAKELTFLKSNLIYFANSLRYCSFQQFLRVHFYPFFCILLRIQ